MTSENKSTATNGAHRHTAAGARSNRGWWPNQLNLEILHQNSPQGAGLGRVLVEDLQVQLIRPPAPIRPGPSRRVSVSPVRCRGFIFAGHVASKMIEHCWDVRICFWRLSLPL